MKKALISIVKLSSIALLTLLIFSCEKEIESKVDLGEIINDAGSFEEPADNYSESEPEEFEENSGNDLYFCTRKTVSLTQGYSDYPQFDPNTQVIFPGNLLQGNTLNNAAFDGSQVVM